MRAGYQLIEAQWRESSRAVCCCCETAGRFYLLPRWSPGDDLEGAIFELWFWSPWRLTLTMIWRSVSIVVWLVSYFLVVTSRTNQPHACQEHYPSSSTPKDDQNEASSILIWWSCYSFSFYCIQIDPNECYILLHLISFDRHFTFLPRI